MYRVKVGENLFSEASAPSKKAARQLAAEEAVKELMAEGRLQLNKVRSGATPGFSRDARKAPGIHAGMSEIPQIAKGNINYSVAVCLFASAATVATGSLQ